MLKEVGKAVLVGGLLDGTDMGCQVELGPLGGLVIVTDVVSQTVVQLAHTCCGVVGKRGLGAGSSGEAKGCEKN